MLRHLEQPANSGLRHRGGARSGKSLPRRAGVSLCSREEHNDVVDVPEEHQQQHATVSYGSTRTPLTNLPLRRAKAGFWLPAGVSTEAAVAAGVLVYPGEVGEDPWYPWYPWYHGTLVPWYPPWILSPGTLDPGHPGQPCWPGKPQPWPFLSEW